MAFIHDHADWPAFCWDESGTSRLLPPPLAAVRHQQGRLISRMEALGFPLRIARERNPTCPVGG